MNYKYGLYTYNTENIGDEIQSIAAKRFLPRVDYYFNRDNINNVKIDAGDRVKLIANGWQLRGPAGWPPKDDKIIPLLTSIYVEREDDKNRADLAFLSSRSRDYIKRNGGKIGARDLGTMEFLRENGIESYFSGCLTLCLLPDKNIQKRDFVLAVDVSDAVMTKICGLTDREIIRINTEKYSRLTAGEAMAIARYWLSLYQSAYFVVSPRLHAMLPSLAFGTPVLAIRRNDMRRYRGLIDLVHNCSEEEFITGSYDFDIDHPKSNPKDFEKIRDSLVKQCKEFTGYDSGNSYMDGQRLSDFFYEPDFISAVAKMADLSAKEEQQDVTIKDQTKIIEVLNKQLVALDDEKKKIEDEKNEMKKKIEDEKNEMKKKIEFLENYNNEIGVAGAMKNLKDSTVRYIKKKL